MKKTITIKEGDQIRMVLDADMVRDIAELSDGISIDHGKFYTTYTDPFMPTTTKRIIHAAMSYKNASLIIDVLNYNVPVKVEIVG
jgi:hypothetical protein